MSVCTCTKCKKVYEEMELMWVKVKERMELLCEGCRRRNG